MLKLLLQLALAAWVGAQLGALITYRTMTLKPPGKPKVPKKDSKSQFDTTPTLDLRRKVRLPPLRAMFCRIESKSETRAESQGYASRRRSLTAGRRTMEATLSWFPSKTLTCKGPSSRLSKAPWHAAPSTLRSERNLIGPTPRFSGAECRSKHTIEYCT